MSTEKILGKIQKCRVGYGGYQDAMFGIYFRLEGPHMGCGDFWGWWTTEQNEEASMAEKDKTEIYGKTFVRIQNLCAEANVKTVNELEGLPVEMEFENSRLKG